MLNPWGFGSACKKKKRRLQCISDSPIRSGGYDGRRVFATALDTRSPRPSTGPRNLIGEDMIATNAFVLARLPACTAAVNYSVSGPAPVPIPVLLTSPAYFYASFPQASNYTYFQGTFHIDSASGRRRLWGNRSKW